MAPVTLGITSRKAGPRCRNAPRSRTHRVHQQERAARDCAPLIARSDPTQNLRSCGAMGVPPSHPSRGVAPGTLFPLLGRVQASQFSAFAEVPAGRGLLRRERPVAPRIARDGARPRDPGRRRVRPLATPPGEKPARWLSRRASSRSLPRSASAGPTGRSPGREVSRCPVYALIGQHLPQQDGPTRWTTTRSGRPKAAFSTTLAT